MIKCAYCGKTIIDKKRPDNDKDYQKAYNSSEHIIQNAIGGVYESVKICCDRCNYHIARLIDKAFCDIFLPFTSSIPAFKKSRNSADAPYSGYFINPELGEDSIFTVDVIKRTSARSSSELVDRLNKIGISDIEKQRIHLLQNSKLLFSDFKLENNVFKNGLAKIAFNFAIYSGIMPNQLSSFINITLSEETGEMEKISFNTQLIPFVALNDFDKSIEFSNLNDEFPPFYNLVIFRYRAQLWCFVNLFDTFQWYVKMSDDFQVNSEVEYEVINSLFQFIQTRPQETDDKKTAHIKEALKLNDTDTFLFKKIAYFAKQDAITDFYLDSNNGGFSNKYHIICASTRVDQPVLFGLFYPECIEGIQNNFGSPQHKLIRSYTVSKYKRLSYYTNSLKPSLSNEFFSSLSDSDFEKFKVLFNKSQVSNRVSKQIDLNVLFPDTFDIHTEESLIKDIIYANAHTLMLQYDGNVNISFIDRNIGPSSLDSLINRIANEWSAE